MLPFYIGLLIVLAVAGGGMIMVGLAYAVAHTIDAYNRRKRRIAREKEQVWRALNRKD